MLVSPLFLSPGVFFQERVSVQFPRSRLRTGRCDHDVSRCSVRSSSPSLSSSTWTYKIHLKLHFSFFLFIFIRIETKLFTFSCCASSQLLFWSLDKKNKDCVCSSSSSQYISYHFCIYLHRPLCVPHRLCLNGKLVSQSPDSGKSFHFIFVIVTLSSVNHCLNYWEKYYINNITKPTMFPPLTDGLCPVGQLYQNCSDGEDGLLPGRGVACERTCESYLLNLTCSTHEPCVAGCTCPAGWVPCTELFCLSLVSWVWTLQWNSLVLFCFHTIFHE